MKKLMLVLIIINLHSMYSLKIASFGASVVEQKNSIWDNFVSHLNNTTNNQHIHYKYGYGSCRVAFTAISKLDQVIENKPDICIIDWFRYVPEGMNEVTALCFEAIIRKLRLNNIKILFYFGYRERNQEEQEEYWNFFMPLAEKYCIPVYHEVPRLDQYKHLIKEPLLRDLIHTTDYGSDFLGKLFCDFFIENYELIMNQQMILPSDSLLTTVQRLHIHEFMVKNYKDRDSDGYWILDKDSELIIPITGCVLALELKLGPYVKSIEVDNGKEKKSYNFFDRWCNYERRTNRTIVINSDAYVRIKVLTEDVDYSVCLKPFDAHDKTINFELIEPLLKVQALYYIPAFFNEIFPHLKRSYHF